MTAAALTEENELEIKNRTAFSLRPPSKEMLPTPGGILAYFDTKLTSGAIEAVNGIIQLAKRMARGFRNFVYFRTAAYLRVGQLNLYVPNMS